MRSAAVLIALALAPALASAQPSLTPPTPPAPPPTPATVDFTRPKPEEYKDPGTAMMLSVGASLAGAGIVALGAWMRDGGDTPIMAVGALVSVVGPSAGAWWAEGRASFTIGFGIRLGGVAVAALGFGRTVDENCNPSNCSVPLQNRHSDEIVGIGAAFVIGGMIYDIATAGGMAERHNERFQLVPTGKGLAVAGRF